MASSAPAPQIWNCPGCGKRYRITAGNRSPTFCPDCRSRRGRAPTESSAFDQLSAVVEAEETAARSGTVAPPPAAAPAALQIEPSPFERLYASVESGSKA